MNRFANSLNANKESLAALLHWPRNVGIQFQELRVGPGAGIALLLVWVDELASSQMINQQLMLPLTAYRGELSAAALFRAIPIAARKTERGPDATVEAVLAGWTALLADGSDEALLLDTAVLPQHPDGKHGIISGHDTLGRDLHYNLALLRKRLRDPSLIAERLDPPEDPAGETCLIYMEGRAAPSLVRLFRCWARKNANEKMITAGQAPGWRAAWGLLPRVHKTRWPDQAAVLLEGGYVVLAADRINWFLMAPVTAASLMLAPDRYGQPQRWLFSVMRVIGLLYVVLAPAGLIALMNYHADMVPTSFLIALAHNRETAPFAIFFEMVMSLLLTEFSRESAHRLPTGISLGQSIIALAVLFAIVVQTGYMGPLAPLTALTSCLLTSGLPSLSAAYFARRWRYLFLVAAVGFGFFGMATVSAILLTYLSQARSWGVPFWGPDDVPWAKPEALFEWNRRKKGGRSVGKG